MRKIEIDLKSSKKIVLPTKTPFKAVLENETQEKKNIIIFNGYLASNFFTRNKLIFGADFLEFST